jgi:predicted RND superfamily exporter protein
LSARNTLLKTLITFAIDKPKIVIFFFLTISFVSLFYAQNIELKTSNLDLISHDLPEVKHFLSFAEEFGTPNVLVAVFEGENPDSLKQAVEKSAPKIRQIPEVSKVVDQNPPSPTAPQEINYLTSKNKKMFFLFIQPKDHRSDIKALEPFIKKVRVLLNETTNNLNDVQVGLTGIPQYAIDDRDVIQKDVTKLSFLSLFLVFIIFLGAFKHVRRPLIATATILLSLATTMGLIKLFPGHLTLLSAPFAAIIFGLGIDYGIHIVHLVEELIMEGHSEKEALKIAIPRLSRSINTAAFTTIGAFLVLTTSGFLGFEELGIISAMNLLVCFIYMYVLLPALLCVFSQKKFIATDQAPVLGNLLCKIKFNIIGPILVLLSVGMIFFIPVPFDSNYLNLQPKDSNTVRLEKRMTNESDFSPYFAVFTTPSWKRSIELAEKLKTEKIVGKVRSVSDLLPKEAIAQLTKSTPNDPLGTFLSQKGNFAVYAYPNGNIWDPKIETEFLEKMKALDKNVTGMPFLGNTMVQQTKKALRTTGALAVFVILFIVSLNFKRPILIALTVVPPLLTALWMQALMNIFNVHFNPINVMALPIVLGIAVDNGAYIVHRFLEDQGDIFITLKHSCRNVTVNALTTLAGFGALIFTSHLGLRSFALATCIGIASTLIISLTILPWLLVKNKSRVIR